MTSGDRPCDLPRRAQQAFAELLASIFAAKDAGLTEEERDEIARDWGRRHDREVRAAAMTLLVSCAASATGRNAADFLPEKFRKMLESPPDEEGE